MTTPRLHLGDRVIVARDETIYPPRGSWSRYRGRNATVVSINTAKTITRPDGQSSTIPAEFGVTFGAVHRDQDGAISNSAEAWFLRHELAWRGDPWPVTT